MEDKRQHIAYVALVVRDYDEAKAYYCGVLGFELIEDSLGRWKEMGAGDASGLPRSTPASGASGNAGAGKKSGRSGRRASVPVPAHQ